MALFGHTKLVVDPLDGPVSRPGSHQAADRTAVRAAPPRHYHGPPATRRSARPQSAAGSRARRVQAHGDHRIRPSGGRGLRGGTRWRRQRGGNRVPSTAQGGRPGSRTSPEPPIRRLVSVLPPAPVRLPVRSAGGPPGPRAVPGAALWRRRVAAAVAAEHREYGDPAGRIRLRRAIARWVARSRSVAAAEDTVVITCGAQHAIDRLPGRSSPATASRSKTPGTRQRARLFGAPARERCL